MHMIRRSGYKQYVRTKGKARGLYTHKPSTFKELLSKDLRKPLKREFHMYYKDDRIPAAFIEGLE